MKIRSVGAELFLADRRTDMAKRIVAFAQFLDAHEKGHKQFSPYHWDFHSSLPDNNGGGIISAE